MKARKIGNQSRRQSQGFTLTELLVVIGIVVVLVGILVPTISVVRKAAYGAKSQQMISQLSTAIEAYYMDYRAYPGPIHNNNVGAGRASGISNVARDITMSENLFLGLSGGLQLNPGTGIFFAPADVTKGPRVLSATGTKTNAFAHANYVQDMPFTKPNATNDAWRFSDGIGQANDTIIPEYVDGYTAPLPILYLRARTGARTLTALGSQTAADNAVITTGVAAAQYDLEHILGYTATDIGEGKDTKKKTLYIPPSIWPQHGLRFAPNLTLSMLRNPPTGLTHAYPYDAYAYLGNPSSLDPTFLRFEQPRQKDGYILISAGPDRIYGTEDDICSFGQLFQAGQ